jgi:anti-sigma factor RsiW
MTNVPENNDDELLSAYLDNELAPEERARVEERLAGDPAARKLLEELRSVSRAVKDLPPATLGADIRDTVLRRAERAMLQSGESASTDQKSLREPRPFPFTIGRSVRGWVWAGLATAAALAIMAFESNSQRDQELPDTVAARRLKSNEDLARKPEVIVADEAKKLESPAGTSVASTPSAAPPTNTPIPAEPAAPSAAAAAASDKFAAGRSAPAVEQELLSENPSASAAPTAGRAESVVASRAGGEAGDKSAHGFVAGRAGAETSTELSSASANPDLVVRVQVHPEAWQRRAFDGVLTRNRIEIDESPADSRTLSESSGAAAAAPSVASEPQSLAKAPSAVPRADLPSPPAENKSIPMNDRSTTTAENPDVVLVEASAPQIQSCLEELHNNEHDYSGVTVSDNSAEQDQVANVGGAAPFWNQYSRGITAQQPASASARTSIAQAERAPEASGRGAHLGEYQQTPQPAAKDKEESEGNGAALNGRALRMRGQANAQTNLQYGFDFGGGASQRDISARQQSNHTREYRGGEEAKQNGDQSAAQLSAAAQSNNTQTTNTLRVLFLLSPDSQLTSPPPAIGTKAAK